MPTVQERQLAAIAKLETGTDTIHKFIHGTKFELVETESGNIPTMSGIASMLDLSNQRVVDLVVATTENLNDLLVEEPVEITP